MAPTKVPVTGTVPAGKRRRPFRSVLKGARFVVGSPAATLGVSEILEGSGFIRQAFRVVLDGGGNDSRLVTRHDQTIDVAATAALYDVTVSDMEETLRRRRSQTAVTSRLLFVFGVISISAWFYVALTVLDQWTRIVSAFEFLPFCVVFFLFAFKTAFTNWQIRTLRMGSAMDYLATDEPFLPR